MLVHCMKCVDVTLRFAGETRDVFRLAPTFFDAAARGRLYGVRLDGLWLHVGAPEAIVDAEAAIARSKL